MSERIKIEKRPRMILTTHGWRTDGMELVAIHPDGKLLWEGDGEVSIDGITLGHGKITLRRSNDVR